MDVRPGYKQTEVGVIPDDWDVVPLSQCLKNSPTYGINAPAVGFDFRLPTYLRITDIAENGRFTEETKVSVDHPKAESYLLHPGDLVFARTGASVGKSYLYNPKDGELVFAGFLIRVQPDPNKLVSKYLSFYVRTSAYWAWVTVNSMRSGQPGINGQEYGTLPIPLPPTKIEQHAIAEALSDADAYIESLEQLIAKKRLIKQGAMQEVLTGKRRLPGFSGEWEEISLGSMESSGYLRLFRGTVISQKDINNDPGPYPIYSSSIHDNGLFGHYGKYMLDEELITWSVDGGGNFFYRPKHRFSVTNVCGYIRILSQKVSCRFLAYKLQQLHSSKTFDYTLKAHPSVIRGQYILDLPSRPEQEAIAEILGDMDVEIDILETSLRKSRRIKQGMMQELLTGRIRLI